MMQLTMLMNNMNMQHTSLAGYRLGEKFWPPADTPRTDQTNEAEIEVTEVQSWFSLHLGI